MGLAVVALLALTPAATADPWVEVGDAGQLPETAQVPVGTGALTSISGTISSLTDVDMYRIFIDNPAAFSATTVGQPGTLFDTQLFLFNADGFGVEANDEAGPVGSGRSSLPAGNPNSPTTPGFYFLAISAFNNDPVASGGLRLFPEPSGIGATVGPTGPGGGEALTGWTGTGFTTGTYTIALTGAAFENPIPEPGACVLFGLGALGLAGCGRRWRRRAA